MEITQIYIAQENGKTVFLSIDDHSGGYPYWSPSFSSRTWKVSEKTTDNIVKNFRNEKGQFYKKDINPQSIQIAKIELVPLEKIKIDQKTDYEKKMEQFSTLSKDDIKFIKDNM